MTKVWEDSKGGEQGVDRYNPAAPDGLLIRHLNLAHRAAFHFGEPVVHERVRAGFAELHLNEPALRRVQIEGLRVTAAFPVWISAVPQQVAAFLIDGVKLRADHVETHSPSTVPQPAARCARARRFSPPKADSRTGWHAR